MNATRTILSGAIPLILAILTLTLCSGCKGTPDYLYDLSPGRSVDNEGKLSRETFDAGQLVHEGFAGLLEAEEFSSRDLARSVASAGAIVANNEVPILRANALAFLGDIARRFPLPQKDEPLLEVTSEEFLREIKAISEAEALLTADGLTAQAFSLDRTVALRAMEQLRERFGEDLGTDPRAYEQRWQNDRPAVQAEVDALIDAPLRRLAQFRIPGNDDPNRLNIGSGVLRLLGYGSIYRPSLQEARLLALKNLCRQVVISAVVTALERTRPLVEDDETFQSFVFQWSELDVATGAAVALRLLDPSLEAPLLRAAVAARGGRLGVAAEVRLIDALAAYPSETAIGLAIEAIGSPNPVVAGAGIATAQQTTGVDFGDDPLAWSEWWTRTGRARFAEGLKSRGDRR